MKRLPHQTWLLYILIVFNHLSFSQSKDHQPPTNIPAQFKTLYLHFDRDNYFLNDTIWFKAYYLQSQSHRLVAGIYSMYTELIDEKGEILDKMIWPISDGAAMGSLTIPDSLTQGKYLIRAYTDLQRQYGEESFFNKIIILSTSYTPTDENREKISIRRQDIDVAFLPEGGDLLENQNNVVGIKAINNLGKAIVISGKIIDGNGDEITRFETSYQGMGSFTFHPLKGESYKAVIDQNPDFEYAFDNIKEHGLKIEYIQETAEELHFQAYSNTKMYYGSAFYFSIMNRGRIIFHQKFTLSAKSFPIKVKKEALPAGINRFMLLDKNYKPISERLLFSKNYEVNQVTIKMDQNSYQTRSKVQLELIDDDKTKNENFSSLSLTVVDKIALKKGGSSLDIQSWLLIDSELKGIIENPSDFFRDDGLFNSDEKLNLLMLTHGWSRYLWNEIPDIENNVEIQESEGLTLSGKVEQYLGKKSKTKVDVDLKIFNINLFINENMKTDNDGRFSFRNLYFRDSASLFIQVRNKNKKLAWEIKIDSLFEENSALINTFIPVDQDFKDISSDLRSKKFYSEKAMREFILESGTIMLDEVIVMGEHEKEEDRHQRYYTKPNNSLQVTKKDLNYSDVIDFIQGRVAGVIVTGDKIMIHGPSSFGSTEPLFLLNGIAVTKEDIKNIPMYDIDLVEVLKDSDAAIFGTRGANGVISVFTKIGVESQLFNNYTPGILSSKIQGYSSYREFYSPKYTPETISSGRPDHRITLYWNPDIITENGKASMSFFTSDDIAQYQIFVEGITESGKICLGTSELSVATGVTDLEDQ